MKVFKWALIVFGAVFVLLVGLIDGAFIHAGRAETENLTVADVEVGGPYSTEERQALLNACNDNQVNEAFDEPACECLADKAGTQLSRFGRLVLEVIFERNGERFVAITMGLFSGEIPPEKMANIQNEFGRRVKALVRSCGLEDP